MPGLDLLRAVAALLVVAFHLTYWTWMERAAQGIPPAFVPLQPVSSRGWVGVQIFFVLSGYVIAYSMNGMTAVRFVRHRVERLLPAAAFSASLTAVVLLAFSQEQNLGGRWLRSLVFWPAGPWIDGSYWTLPIEVAFYGLMACVLLVRRGRYFSPVICLLGTVSAACDLLLVGRPSWLRGDAYLQLGRCWFPPYACWLLVYGCFFALGSLLFLLLSGRGTGLHAIVGLFALAGCVADILWHDRGLIFANPRHEGGWGSAGVWLVAVGVLIVSVRWNARILESLHARALKGIRIAGLATYPLYLLHAQIGEWLIHGLIRRVGAVPALLTATAAVVGLALVVTMAIEPRLRALLRRVLDGSRLLSGA